MQGMGFACHSGSPFKGHGVSRSADASLNAHCAGGDASQKPGDGRHSSDCCLYCSAICREIIAPLIAFVVVALLGGLVRRESSKPDYGAYSPHLAPPGWTSSWSSRAPPALA